MDRAYKQTEKQLSMLTKRLDKIYDDALKNELKDNKDILKKFDELNEKIDKRYANYDEQWKKDNKDFIAQMKAMEFKKNIDGNELAKAIYLERAKTGEIASQIIQGETVKTYDINARWTADSIKMQAPNLYDVDFNLFDTNTLKVVLNDTMPPFSKVAHGGLMQDKKVFKKIQNEIAQALLLGESQDKVIKRIQNLTSYEKKRAKRIAQTELNRIRSQSRYETMQKVNEMGTGVEIKKEWRSRFITSGKGKTRDTHLSLHGTVIPMDEDFVSKSGAVLRYVGDSQGKASEVINCFCVIVPRVINPDDAQVPKVDSEPKKDDNEDVKLSKDGERIEKDLITRKVDYLPVQNLNRKLSDEEIIMKLGGGDLTEGSCSSLALAFIGNKNGYDITDFRGGDSCDVFATLGYIKRIVNQDGVNLISETNLDGMKATKRALKLVEEGKTYYFVTGRHASAIKREGGKIQYLELQSASDNGWKIMTEETLKYRFKVTKSRSMHGFKFEQTAYIAEGESLANSNDYKKLMGYLNTSTGEQKKGSGGYEK